MVESALALSARQSAKFDETLGSPHYAMQGKTDNRNELRLIRFQLRVWKNCRPRHLLPGKA